MIFQPHINGLRALAVISVVLFHFQLLGANSGFVGVDVFFVISGYLMTQVLLQNSSTTGFAYFTNFWIARGRRILPALIVVTIVSICVFSTFLLLPDYRKFLRSTVTANLFFSNYFFLSQNGYFDTAAINHPLLHTWSLSVEWQFYLIYPFLIYFARRWSFRAKFLALTFFSSLSYAYCVFLTAENPIYAYFKLSPRAWEFLLGGIAYLVEKKINAQTCQCKNISINLLGSILLFVLICSFFGINESSFPGWVAIIPAFTSASIIVAGNRGVANWLLSTPSLQLIGKLSYSLYLWHWPIYVYLITSANIDTPMKLEEKILGLIISTAFSYFSYKWVEQPVRLKTNFWTTKRLVIGWILSVTIILLALTNALTSNNTGYRLPYYLANAENALKDKNPRQDECFLDAEKAFTRNFEPSFCQIGINKPLGIDAILWGDSFSDAIQPVVDDVLKEKDLSGIVSTLAGCLPLDKNPYLNTAKQQFDYCEKGVNQKTLQRIKSQSSLKYVVISANWVRYDTEILLSNFAQSICALKKLNRIPILIGPIPSPNYDVPRVWGKLELKKRNSIDQMVFPRSNVSEAENLFFRLISNISSTCDAPTYILPSNTFCKQDDCYAVKDGHALYVDDVHLSTTGSYFLKNELAATLETR